MPESERPRELVRGKAVWMAPGFACKVAELFF